MANPKIQLRHDTAANWTSVNPVLLEGEVGIETDTRKQKFGDGTTAWNNLAYDLGSTAARVLYVEYGVTTYNEIYNAYSTGTQISCAYNHLVYTLDNYRNNKFAFTAIDNSDSSQQYSNNSKIKIKCFTVSSNNTYSQITISDIVSTMNTSNTKIRTTDNTTTTPLTLQTNVSDCWLGFSASSGWLGSYGVDSTCAPVYYAGALEHIATQEWINDNGYLTGITSSNVTSALGYTPVNKSGDTMTGNLNFSNSGQSTIGLNGISTSSYADITYTDGSNTRLAHLRAYNDSSTKRRAELVVMNDNGSPAGNGVRVTYENGAESCEFPNTKCVDGQWVNTSVQLANNVSLPVGNEQEITYDLSSAIPNDNYKYEVVLNYGVQTGNSSGAGLSANIIGSGDSIWHRICDTYARGSWYMVVGGNVVVTVSTARTVRFHYTTVSKAGQLNYLFVEGYKRVGTNA